MTDFNFRRRRLSQRMRRRDISIVEILTGLVILGLVAGLVGPRVFGYRSDAREHTAQVQITSFASALDLFRLDVGRYPTDDEGLEALVRKPGTDDHWAGPYLKPPILPRDPWGDAYEYRGPDPTGPYAITSPGLDANRPQPALGGK